MPKPLRNIRVDDVTWLNAQRVADFYDTSVSAMIVGFLEQLRIGYIPANVAKRAAGAVRQVPKESLPPKKKRPQNPTLPTTRPRPASDRVKVDPATCTHQVQKELPYGTFCTACGTKTKARR